MTRGMNFRIGWGMVLIAIVLRATVGVAAPAEEGTAPVPENGATITLERAARAALTHHQPYLISQETVTQLVQQRRQAISALLPSLTLDAYSTRRSDEAIIPSSGNVFRAKDEYGYSATLTQPLFAGGKAISGLRSASAQLHAGEQAEQQSREDLLLNVAQAYYGVLKAEKQVALFEAERTRLREHRRAAEVQLKVGQVTKTVLLRAAAELAGAEASLIRAQSDEATARDQLAQVTGLPADAALVTPSVPPPSSDEPAALLADADARRPELLRSQLIEQASLYNVKVARSGLFPSLWLDLVYEKSEQDPNLGFSTEDADQFAMLRLNFPFFEGGLQIARIREARSQWRAAMLDTQFVRETVTTEVRTALRSVSALTSSVEQFTAQVAFAKENYELTSRQFAVGLATNLDMLDANSTLLTAEQQLAAATFDRDLAVLQLYRSTGRLTSYLLPQ